jgi:catechol 2,3-dioxygenase-like lactoylglutathione lyase family enzyme
MPNIENLRKQAKRYLKWHREGYYPVAAQIRSMLPHFRDLTDSEILQAGFKLNDAQELVARKHGFETWFALIKGIETMTASSINTVRKPMIIAAEPQLFVTDMEASRRFYCEKLGFDIAFTYGEPPFYAQVFRDGGRLNLRKVQAPVFDSGFRARERDVLSTLITVDDAKALFLEFVKAGVIFHQSLRTEPWGARVFIVVDPDGNLIGFAGSANGQATDEVAAID